MNLTSKKKSVDWSFVLSKLLKMTLAVLVSTSAFAGEHPALMKVRKLSLVNGCRIYNFSANWVKTIPGQYCLFNDDGSVISADDKVIRRFNKLREVVWEIPGHFHHQINFTNDGKNILALSSELLKENNRDVRYDKFMIISMDGKVLHEQSARELLYQTKQKSLDFKMNAPMKEIFKVENEATHFNSIYEIPEIAAKNVPSYIRKNNIIINGIEHGTFILSPDLKTILKHELFDQVQHNIHDVQVRRNGHYLFFNNRADEEFSVMLKYSAIQELDPQTKKKIFEFTGNPKYLFYSPYCGAVQEIDNDLIGISHVINGFYFYSRSAKTIVASVPGFIGNELVYHPSQQIKAYDLDQFIKNWDN